MSYTPTLHDLWGVLQTLRGKFMLSRCGIEFHPDEWVEVNIASALLKGTSPWTQEALYRTYAKLESRHCETCRDLDGRYDDYKTT